MTAPDRIYIAGEREYDQMYTLVPIGMWQTEYIHADKVLNALEQLKSIQAYIEATNSDNSFLRDKVLAAIKHLKA